MQAKLPSLQPSLEDWQPVVPTPEVPEDTGWKRVGPVEAEREMRIMIANLEQEAGEEVEKKRCQKVNDGGCEKGNGNRARRAKGPSEKRKPKHDTHHQMHLDKQRDKMEHDLLDRAMGEAASMLSSAPASRWADAEAPIDEKEEFGDDAGVVGEGSAVVEKEVARDGAGDAGECSGEEGSLSALRSEAAVTSLSRRRKVVDKEFRRQVHSRLGMSPPSSDDDVVDDVVEKLACVGAGDAGECSGEEGSPSALRSEAAVNSPSRRLKPMAVQGPVVDKEFRRQVHRRLGLSPPSSDGDG